MVAMGLVMMLALFLFSGCSKKPEVETEPQVAAEEQAEEVPVPVVPEETEVVEEVVDYANLAPADYGVEDVFFAFDQYDLDNESMSILSRNARILREAGVAVLVSGHCDERGTVEYNLALGEKRAMAVRDYLVSLGVPASSLKVTSYGESKPFAYGSNESAWDQNRRAHFERP